jgi:hypothetical protein
VGTVAVAKINVIFCFSGETYFLGFASPITIFIIIVFVLL